MQEFNDIDRERENYEHENMPSFDQVTKKEATIPTIQSYLDFIIDSVGSGMTNPIEAYATIQTIEKMFKSCKAAIDLAAQEEAERYGEKTFEAYGYQVTKTDGKRSWDFKQCPEWIEAKEYLKNLEEDLKDAYKRKEKGQFLGSTVTGEIEDHLILPTLKYSKPSLTIKKK